MELGARLWRLMSGLDALRMPGMGQVAGCSLPAATLLTSSTYLFGQQGTIAKELLAQVRAHCIASHCMPAKSCRLRLRGRGRPHSQSHGQADDAALPVQLPMACMAPQAFATCLALLGHTMPVLRCSVGWHVCAARPGPRVPPPAAARTPPPPCRLRASP